MIDMMLDRETHDLVFDNGAFVDVLGIDRIAQHVKITLWTFLGEWYLDNRVGFPYLEIVFIKNPPMRPIKTLIRDAIMTVDGVLSATRVDLTIDPARRRLTVDADVLTTERTIHIQDTRTWNNEAKIWQITV